MKYNIRLYNSADYLTLCDWWRKQDWQPVDAKALPKLGLIADSLAAAFLYKTDSNIAWLEWVVVNPEADKKARRFALDLILESLLSIAKDQGFTNIFTSSNHPRLMSAYKEHGFVTTDTNVTQFIRKV